MKKQNDQSLVSFPFSWENQRKNAAHSLMVCALFITGVIIIWVLCVILSVPIASLAVGSIMILFVCQFGLRSYGSFLLTSSSMQKHIQAWKSLAEQMRKEKEKAEYRQTIMRKYGIKDCFERLIAEDKKFIEDFNKSHHVDELKMFEEVMNDKNLIARFKAMLMPYKYWYNKFAVNNIA